MNKREAGNAYKERNRIGCSVVVPVNNTLLASIYIVTGIKATEERRGGAKQHIIHSIRTNTSTMATALYSIPFQAGSTYLIMLGADGEQIRRATPTESAIHDVA
jgi:hypothetical protein